MTSHLIRAGRYWLNPCHVISVEDRTSGPSILLPIGKHMVVTVIPGNQIDLFGPDAEELRRSLEGPRPGSGTVISGSGPGHRVVRRRAKPE